MCRLAMGFFVFACLPFFFSFLFFSHRICVSFCLPAFVAGNLLYVLNWFVTSDYIRCIMWYFVTLAPFPVVFDRLLWALVEFL